MRLTIVGCAGSYPNPSSPASCYLIEHDGARIVLDLGNGSLGDLQQYLDPLDESALAAVVLSHCHVDHCADVASLYVHAPLRAERRRPRRCHCSVRPTRATASPPSTAWPTRRSSTQQFDVRTLGAGPADHRPVPDRGRARPRTPSRPTRSGSTAGGMSITYSGDTGPTRAAGRPRPGHRHRAVRGVLRRDRQPAEPAPDRRGGRSHRQRGGRRAPGAHPPRGLERRGRGARGGRGRVRRTDRAGPAGDDDRPELTSGVLDRVTA